MPATWENLADELDKVGGVPNRVVKAARRGHFSEFRSESATPKQDLIQILRDLGGYDAFITRIVSGEFDDTVAEARDWMVSKEGFQVLRDVFPSVSRDRWKQILGITTTSQGGASNASTSVG